MDKSKVILFICGLVIWNLPGSLLSNTKQCYDELGCFDNGYPWNWLLRPFPSPQSPEKVNTTFYIINRELKEKLYFQTWPKIDTSHYHVHKPSYILVHGYYSNSDVDWMQNLTNAILNKRDANVLCVDWSKGSTTNYIQAAANIRIVGAEITRVVKHLINFQMANAEEFHLIGHSLGAHIMSYVGKNITGISRITALDPAQPGFQAKDPAVRIDKKDAKLVDIIHTDGKAFVPFLGLGMTVSVGHIDFFVNGGFAQPNCFLDDKPFIKSIADIPKITLDVLYNLASCSHTRAPRYMIAAINGPCKMWGYRYNAKYSHLEYSNFIINKTCTKESCSLMGLDTQNYSARGNFAMETSGSYPFCIEDKKSDIQMENIDNADAKN
ncbi:inactive pancreatic lipase-related protein 1-like [Vespula pensylvanica]|uniref:phospholipase A1 n=1 Tax=Vespula pensylvanica TaxID=30213 RepID=A0A834U7F9_VESPE|nr:inactive pancreatic lipase-related protein 1-like [Vespula pensylvanica]KAF7419916.1 hypothetical protein H0235_010213 [Vespula pensylvanica]